MNELMHLLKHDFRLLYRNNIIAVSIIVSVIYVVIFLGLSTLGDIEKFLILVIFNDPAILGLLFIGVMVLFEKNERTLQALSVTPVNLHHYLLSKSLSLTIVALGCCVAMVLAAYGTNVRWLFFVLATFITTMLFSFIGFILVAGHKSFTAYLLPMIGIIILLSLPFIGYFEIMPEYWFYLFPTYPAIELFKMAFVERIEWGSVFIHYMIALVWVFITYRWAYQRMQKDFSESN